jgi:hypothetical protein
MIRIIQAKPTSSLLKLLGREAFERGLRRYRHEPAIIVSACSLTAFMAFWIVWFGLLTSGVGHRREADAASLLGLAWSDACVSNSDVKDFQHTAATELTVHFVRRSNVSADGFDTISSSSEGIGKDFHVKSMACSSGMHSLVRAFRVCGAKFATS